MRRTERLFQIIQVLRSKRRPVIGRDLADELEISLRTLYRDMAELIAQRVPIRGEAGIGYVLGAGYDMPPLMLTHDELEAAVLGAAWVAKRGDPSLGRGARDLIAKIAESIPAHLRPVLLDAGLRPFLLSRLQLKDSTLPNCVAPFAISVRSRSRTRMRITKAPHAPSGQFLLPIWRRSGSSRPGANRGAIFVNSGPIESVLSG